MVKRVVLVAILILLTAPSPALAQGSVLDKIRELLGPVEDAIDEFANLANTDYVGSAEDYFGINWRSTSLTNQQFITSTAPITGYYDTAPDQVRDLGYSVDQLSGADTASMSPMDYASWLGAMVALPFQMVRGLRPLGEILGPLGTFLGWLFVAATWVTFVYFVEFLMKTIRSVFGIGNAIMGLISKVKP